ncbi:DUF1822 family protein [Anabaena catenula]|uniref:DUF1822 family protein n=1 Tax=Anabaena catenula FACHB-362 TaxID=2692877 RepID=A0ABR8JCQ0_9NOST|nr:DUF1822 family protein [Anabaena catenula]MBD2695067.1 DUF1822 family protein [Anabaena catenula FACHB-362]
MNRTTSPLLMIPLDLEIHSRARYLASQQSTVEKGKRVYLNALAVYAVHRYLKWLQIPTDLTESDCWNPVKAALSNVADLVIPNVGTLECCPVLPTETVILLPSNIENRIGYVGIQFQESLDSVQLLGFVPAFDEVNVPVQLAVSELQPIESLLQQISRLEEAIAFLQTDDSVAVQVRSILENKPLTEIAAQFELLYRTGDEFEWRYAGGEILAVDAMAVGATREIIEQDDSELQDLAEMLMEKLAEIWEDAA